MSGNISPFAIAATGFAGIRPTNVSIRAGADFSDICASPGSETPIPGFMIFATNRPIAMAASVVRR